eukprot:1135196-Rhodomonas_salina.6
MSDPDLAYAAARRYAQRPATRLLQVASYLRLRHSMSGIEIAWAAAREKRTAGRAESGDMREVSVGLWR